MGWEDIFSNWGSPEDNLGSYDFSGLTNDYSNVFQGMQAPEFGNLFSGANFNTANLGGGLGSGGGEGAVGWDSVGRAASGGPSPVGSSGGGFGDNLSKWWGNVQQGFTDPRNLARLATGAGTSLINQAFAPKTKVPSQVQGYYNQATQAAQAQENFANQQAANYNAYRVPLQRQITNTASFLGTPEDIENYTNKKLADQQARIQGAKLQSMRALESQGYGPASGRAQSEARKLQFQANLGMTNARNQGMQERQDWALGQQANAARLWETPNYNPALYAGIGSNYAGTLAGINQMNRLNAMDIGRGIGDILTYDPEEQGRNRRATTPQTPAAGRYGGIDYRDWWQT